MKKVIHAILAGLLLCAAFAGCSAAGEDAAQSALEELSSRLDVLSQRVDELESAQAQQLTPAPEEETSAGRKRPPARPGKSPPRQWLSTRCCWMRSASRSPTPAWR